MLRSVRIIALFLLTALVTAFPGAQAMERSAPPLSHPAPCHSQSPVSPAPAIPDYHCCASGHHAAIPEVSFSLRSIAVRLCWLVAAEQTRLTFHPDTFSPSAAPFRSPPGAAPLRI